MLIIGLLVCLFWAEYAREWMAAKSANQRAQALARKGQFEEERAIWQKIQRNLFPIFAANYKPQVAERQGWLALQAGRYEEALAHTDRSLKAPRLKPSKRAQLCFLRAEAFEGMAFHDKAIRERRRVEDLLSQLHPSQHTISDYKLRSEIAGLEGRRDDQIHFLQAAMHAPIPKSLGQTSIQAKLELLYFLAMASLHGGGTTEAIRYCREAIAVEVPAEAASGKSQVHALLSYCLCRIGDLEAALDQADVAWKMAGQHLPLSAYALVRQAAVQCDYGDFDEAISLLDEAQPHAPRQALQKRAEIRLLRGELQLARGAVEECRDLPPQQLPSQERVARASTEIITVTIALFEAEFSRSNTLEETLELCDSLTEIMFHYPAIRISCEAKRAMALAQLGRREESRQEIDRCRAALDCFLDDAFLQRNLRSYLGRAHYYLGESELAIADLESYLQTSTPAYIPQTHYYLGLCHEKLGHPDAARSHWQQGADHRAETFFSDQCRQKLAQT